MEDLNKNLEGISQSEVIAALHKGWDPEPISTWDEWHVGRIAKDVPKAMAAFELAAGRRWDEIDGSLTRYLFRETSICYDTWFTGSMLLSLVRDEKGDDFVEACSAVFNVIDSVRNLSYFSSLQRRAMFVSLGYVLSRLDEPLPDGTLDGYEILKLWMEAHPNEAYDYLTSGLVKQALHEAWDPAPIPPAEVLVDMEKLKELKPGEAEKVLANRGWNEFENDGFHYRFEALECHPYYFARSLSEVIEQYRPEDFAVFSQFVFTAIGEEELFDGLSPAQKRATLLALEYMLLQPIETPEDRKAEYGMENPMEGYLKLKKWVAENPG